MYLGMDLGSRSVKLACLEQDEITLAGLRYEDIRFFCYDTIDFYRRYTKNVNGKVNLDLSALNLPLPASFYACGYGRQAAAFSDAVPISEIEAHGWGACYQSGARDFLLIDLGGQDSKIIRVKDGKVRDFSTNDKCAAGSGRYLENMAHILGFTPEELGQYWEGPVLLSSTCAVFGESELIGKITEGCTLESLAAGVNYSVVRRLLPIITRHLPAPSIFFSGGVAQNQAVCLLLKKELDQNVTVLDNPQFNGAIGCLVKALKK
jgi:(R)-2-hydroxyacyl-CoA dehydratese activating ATPase